MPNALQAQVQASIAPSDSAIQLLIEPDPAGAPDLDIHLLLYPAVGAYLAASAGVVRYGNNKSVPVAGGVITFSGSSKASLPKLPTVDNPVFMVLYSFDTQGQPIPISVQFDRLTGAVEASAECYAAVAYTTYKTTARELIYTPLTESLGQGTRTTFGVICAYYPPRSQVIYEVQPFSSDDGNVEVEVYRIVSGAVTNNDGEFEKPPSYPASGAYPDKTLVLDTSQTLETERVHEIGYMDQRGRAWVRSLFVPTKEPYVGDGEYAPNKSCKVSTIPPDLFSKELIAKATNWVKQRGYGCKGGSGA